MRVPAGFTFEAKIATGRAGWCLHQEGCGSQSKSSMYTPPETCS